MAHPDYMYEHLRALRLRAEGRFDEAIEIYRQRLISHPLDHSASLGLAVTLSAKGDDEAALRECGIVVSRMPDSYIARMTMANILLKQRKWIEALAEAEQMARIHPELSAPFAYAARAHAGLEDIPSAIQCYERAVRLGTPSHDTILSIGELYKNVGRIADAIAMYRKSLERAPRFLQARVRLGELLAGAGRVGEAREQWREVLNLAASTANAHTAPSNVSVLEATEFLRGLKGFQEPSS